MLLPFFFFVSLIFLHLRGPFTLYFPNSFFILPAILNGVISKFLFSLSSLLLVFHLSSPSEIKSANFLSGSSIFGTYSLQILCILLVPCLLLNWSFTTLLIILHIPMSVSLTILNQLIHTHRITDRNNPVLTIR